MSKLVNYVGIDVSKKTLDTAFDVNGKIKHEAFANNEKGFKLILSKLPAASHCVMEVTGIYYLKLATYLYDHQIPVSVINPLVIKRFSTDAVK